MTVSIIGCGWFGFDLAKAMVKDGHTVKGATTTPDKMDVLREEGIAPFLIRISAEEEVPDASFFDCDVLVITIPPKVSQQGGDAYLAIQQRLIDRIQKHHIRKIIFISSTSVYGDVNDQVDEDTFPTPDTLSGQVLIQAEKRYTSITTFQTTVIRFGGLVGPGRDPGRFFAGKENISNGLAPVNLIHLDDCVGISKEVIRKDFFGVTINACSPHHPTRSEFYTNASRIAGLAEPKFVEELVSWKVVKSKVVGVRLGYEFRSQLTSDRVS